MKRLSLFSAAALALSLFTLAGCGGGGGGSSSGTPSGNSTVGVFVTDSFSDDFSQVWVTLYKIEAAPASGVFQTLFEDTVGKVINVASLTDTAQFLSSVNVPAGNFTQVRITFGDHLTLVPKNGGASINAPVDDSIGVHAGGKVALTIQATTTTTPGQLSNLVVDFDLAAFELVSGKLRPHVKKADDNSFHQKHKSSELEGLVSNLQAGTGFDLAGEHGRNLHIVITSSTSIFSENAGATATLANGQKVEVKGTVDEQTHVVTADSVKIDDRSHGGNGGNGGDDHSGDGGIRTGVGAEGSVASIDATAKTFVLTLREAQHFTPTGGTVIIKVTDTTVIDQSHNDHAGFGNITAGAKAEATGTYDPATNTLTAVRVEIK